MDMNRSFFQRKEDRDPKWRVIDANGKILGRLATEIADALRGKDKACYTPHTDCGDYIVVLNADKIVLTGRKMVQKEYITHSGWQGGKKVVAARDLLKKHPTRLVLLAVKRMLPKNRLSDQVIKKLKLYVGSEHPHQAQV